MILNQVILYSGFEKPKKMDFKFGHNTWYLPNPHPRNPTPQNPDSSFSPLSRRSRQSPDWISISISISKLDLDLDPSQLVFSSLSVALLKLLQFLIGIQVRTPSRKLSTSSSSSDCLLIRQQLQDAIGALDGTHIQLTIPLEDQSRYRNRKGETSTNALGVCDANLRFSYVLPGWEGSTSDSRVLRDALRRPNDLKLPSNKYFLVDAGYTNGSGFLAPYRGTRYHIKSWRENGPRNYKELFNQRHSSARNTIERAFGLLKKRWAILRTASFYSIKTQIRIINACCILHNFLREEMNEDDLLNDVDRELEDDPVLEIENVDEDRITTVRVTNEWSNFRDDLAMQMWVRERSEGMANPDAKGYQNRLIENWDDIMVLCAKDRANGEGAETFEEAANAIFVSPGVIVSLVQLLLRSYPVKCDIVLRVLVLWSHLFRFSLSFDIACFFVE
ncbi:uncharacterized protein LOC109834772 [Asparagus officinalis]|uniref:uncharacterized protein LOC109834772 n=1 Tax=Asparagus officinalis TaxID=4686 RepID=UPI00098E4420|nr:uncharacterized protein LOC109834772 [Asparagus officinalis]